MGEEFPHAFRVAPACLVLVQEQFAEHEAAQARRGVQTGKGEDGDGQRQKRPDRAVYRRGFVSEHRRDTGGERYRRRAKAAAGVRRKDHAHGDQGYHAERGFNQHSAVTNGFRVCLFGKLFGGSTRRHKGVEAGTRATGNRDKEGGEERPDPGFPAGKGGNFKRRVSGNGGDHNTDYRQNHHAVEQVTGQIVAGLEQNPDRRKGGNCDIDADQHDPRHTGHGKPDVQAEYQHQADADNPRQRRGQNRQAHAGCGVTVNDRQHDKQDGDHSRGFVAVRIAGNGECNVRAGRGECPGDDVDKGRNHQNQH